MKRFFSVVLVFLAMSIVSALAEIYPSRPITIVVPFPPGGSSDVVTRLVAQKLADNLQANVVIDNRGGGGGVPAAIAIKQTPPDGYTLFLANNGLFAIMPALSGSL
jgi:tripartite-type tricarboxylate transporter receptor subunit TctC